MIELNKYKLSSVKSAMWGDIRGDINKQEDLVEYINALDPVKRDEVLALLAQEDANVKAWIEEQGYLKEHQPLKTVNGESLVGEGNIEIHGGGGLTPEERTQLDPMFNKEVGVLVTSSGSSIKFPARSILNGEFDFGEGEFMYNRVLLYQVDDEIFYLKDGTSLYEYDKENFTFIHKCDFATRLSGGVMWKDNSGRYYFGTKYKIDINTGEYVEEDMGGTMRAYATKSNLIKSASGKIYLPYFPTGSTVFNEDTQRFDACEFTYEEGFPTSDFANYRLDYLGETIFVKNGSMYAFKEFGEGDIAGHFYSVYPQYFPTMIDGTNIQGQYLARLNNDKYYYFSNTSVYELIDGEWNLVDMDWSLDTSSQSRFYNCGATTGSYFLGYVNVPIPANYFRVINPTDNDIVIEGGMTTTWETGYAKESWVESQGYLKEHQPLKTVNGESLIGEGNIEIHGGGGGLTPEQEAIIEKVSDTSAGVFGTLELEGHRVFQDFNYNFRDENANIVRIKDDLFVLDSSNFKKFNKNTLKFEDYHPVNNWSWGIMWFDNNGVLYGSNYRYNEDGSYEDVDLGQIFNWVDSPMQSIFYVGDNIFSIEQWFNGVSKFNEDTQVFEPYPYEKPDNFNGFIKSDNNSYYAIADNQLMELKDDGTKLYFEVTDDYDGDSVANMFRGFGLNRYFLTDNDVYCANDNNYHLEKWNAITKSWDVYLPHIGYGMRVIPYDNMLVNFNNNVLVNFGDARSYTGWIAAPSMDLVDLKSVQRIFGMKKFNNISTQSISTSYIESVEYLRGDKINIAADRGVNINKLDINDVPAATMGDLIANKKINLLLDSFEVISDDYRDPSFSYIWVMDGDIYSSDGNESYVLNAERKRWEPKLFSVNVPDYMYRRIARTSNNDAYCLIDNNIYKWSNDYTKDWIFVTSLPEGSYGGFLNILPGDYLGVYGANIKLNVNDLTWENASVPYNKTTFYNGEVYFYENYGIYKIGEGDSFENLGNVNYWDSYEQGLMTIQNELIGVDSDRFYKIDLSKVGTGEPLDTMLDLTHNPGAFAIGETGIYTYKDGFGFGFFYGYDYVTPEVPADDGIYVLKATRYGNEIIYKWSSIDELRSEIQ